MGKVMYTRKRERQAVVQPEACLTFSSAEAFSLSCPQKAWDGRMEIATDLKDWRVWDGSTVTGTEIYVRGTGNTIVINMHSDYQWVLSGSNISCRGNVETVLDYKTVKNGGHPAMASYCFACMFYQQTALIEAPDLPATDLADYCYYGMFWNTSIVSPPVLPATTLKAHCYDGLFYICRKLTTAPELPATTLTEGCYWYMFYQCASLLTAPSLPATVLTANCYTGMFNQCTSLPMLPALPATTLTDNCYKEMFYGCQKIKLSRSATSEYTQEYRIPTSGTGTALSASMTSMFSNSGGSFTGAPTINTTYYLHKDCRIV